MTETLAAFDGRVLVLAPHGRDAAVVASVMAGAGHPVRVCATLGELVEQLADGAGLAIVTEESFHHPDLPLLYGWLQQQPPWADLPLIVLATKQASRRSASAFAVLEGLGNSVLLERPLNAETLASAAMSALRSRRRQYQTREHLEEQTRIGLENRRLYETARAAMAQAAQARETLALALDAADLGTFHCPMPWQALVWNETCKRHFWLPPDARVDFEVFLSIIHPEDREATQAAVERSIATHTGYDVEYRTVAPDGRTRWVRAKGRAYYDADGTPTRFDGITIDISLQKALERQREGALQAERDARSEAEHASRMKDEFLATLSHELRTPLAAILGWVHVARSRGAASVELPRALDTIERNARTQARLIDELLDMSRIIANNVHLELQPLMPWTVVESVVASLEPAAAAKSLRVSVKADRQAGPVLADAHRLQQIAWNLLSNAIKFTPTGGRVIVELRRDGDETVLCVADSGQGIDASFLPFVFERFRQADGSSTRSHGGLGLGLAIVRHLVELHGGSVRAHSDGHGRGARFEVRLPRADARQDGVAARASPPLAPAVSALLPLLEGLRVLLVDDDPDGRESTARILASRGARVATAGTAFEAVELLEARGADVLVSDIGLPLIDGHDLLREMRRRGHGLPALALSAYASSEDCARSVAAGYAAHLPKPVDPPLLVDVVSRVSRIAPAAVAPAAAPAALARHA